MDFGTPVLRPPDAAAFAEGHETCWRELEQEDFFGAISEVLGRVGVRDGKVFRVREQPSQHDLQVLLKATALVRAELIYRTAMRGHGH